MANRPKPTRPLSCHKCGSSTLTIESDTDYAKRGGVRRVTATAICDDCGNRWPSVHPDAVKLARAKAAA